MGLKKVNDTTVLHTVSVRDYARDASGLMVQLKDPAPEVRRWAARDLAQFSEAAEALGQRLAVEAEPSVREVLFTSLATVGGPAAVEALLPLLRSEDPTLRNGAIEGLSHLPQEAGQRIDRLLRDPDADVRIFTVNLLGYLQHQQVGAWLVQVLEREADVNVVGAALEVITEIGQTDHLGALEAARRRFADDPFIGFAIDVARARIEAS